MNTEIWPEIERRLLSVVVLDDASRRDYWQRHTVDPRVRQAVESLLLRRDDAEDLTSIWCSELGGLIDLGDGFGVPPSSSDPASGDRIGPYVLDRELGRGGMGQVWAATQAGDAFEREVAVKVLRASAGDAELRRRFLMERQILGGLSHPSITRLYDVGLSDEGRPYLVMELVDGQPIDRYCRERRLDVDERLGLVDEICDAVDHAHRNLVIHRDLKPSNILVSDDGRPKLLDFGIAKALDPARRRGWTETQAGLRLLTPRYAAPEQIRGEVITTAADIYSLGVVLYELLAEQSPFHLDAVEAAPFENARLARLPTPPSRVRTGPAYRVASAGDLDAIVFKAMRHEPTKRYGTVEALRRDVRRWRHGLPVSARGDHWAYLASRYVRRYRVAATAVLVVLVLVAGFSFRLTQQQLRLDSEAMVSAQVSELMAVLFEGAGAEVGSGSAVAGDARSLADVLDVAAHRFPMRGTPAPVQAAVHEALGRSFLRLFRPLPALKQLTEALRIRRLELGQEEHPALAATLHDVGWAHFYAGRLESGEQILRSALDRRARLHGDDSLEVAETALLLARILKVREAMAESRLWIERAVAIRDERLGEDHLDSHVARSDLASWWASTGDLDAAARIWRGSLDTLRSDPANRVQLARALVGLASVLTRQGQLDQADALADEALSIRRDHFGEHHPYSAAVLAIQADILRQRGDFTAAEQLVHRYIVVCEAVAGPRHYMAAQARAKLAMLRFELQPSESALAALDREIVLASEGLGEEHHLVRRWRSWRQAAQRELGQPVSS